ncbi:Exodeoxyribonuclease V, gamma subunit (RecC) [Mycobacteroides abscessus subsp. bolletii]|uniref:exodeoxyribonuclease V subunit gamma n=1 Tax=Mycobacteroides abscessus TaxID=36809 RepID=UPI000927570C|nr:exodeoxyribonuclease V subunit gamma [Mycobacteroides abscessus]SHQ34249.1 Exodeoxyribonuclease V, gamma subunit (RecC) [Mycobacteroides abscessus subsp. bolletii]SHS09120.1 Exodeoxyribonuclease V, gamma subunit (RecC) [Mycobacteroides abscessus subsp. bolletii]SHS81972.1 Exodeoxyribonuclease V, gamma subunit (RecC) [Mycobacteroides abscessus subsp. bolletii]SHS85740.1 Exodeoxyribonuclease V, gamma subunit (RecC) [Mycobacteroides abscessus subsp. bolletii]SHX72664.1 Exodeoxyribonuclease V, 
MALHLRRAERTDMLADGLARLLAEPAPDPFTEELVLVPAKGIERWLSQRLSDRLGVCAGVRFRSPRSLIAEITGTVDNDPWSPDALVWPLLAVIDENLDQSWAVPLASHLGAFEAGEERELRQGRRYAVARRLAGLFASYARQRPGLLVSWLDGDPAEPDLAWQPPLWRALVSRVDAVPPHVRHDQVRARLREAPSDLPPRISLFGHTRLPVTDVELLDALATHHELYLWLPHPSDALWQTLASDRDCGPVPRREDIAHRSVRHPLLATLGRDVRELQRALPEPTSDEYLSGTTFSDSLLGWLQSDLAADEVRPQGRALAAHDHTVQVHSCHGPARQIDVLREVLLGLLADDPTLEPRDILVMCPDIETYAPLISARFGLGESVPGAHPAHQLRVRLADRALVQTNPLLTVAGQILSLASGRATASEVLNLAEATPVRMRFGFTDDDLDAITAWVREANIRWGFDPEHRAPYGVDFLHNTWRFGIDRILAGVAVSEDAHAWLGATLPLDDVSSNRVELAGRFAEFVSRLHTTVTALSGTRSLAEWLTILSTGIDALATDSEDWPRSQMLREFAEIQDAAVPISLQLSDIRALLDRHLAGRPTRANFRTGTLTVCTMVPMRSVPHRVVCLVGLDDGVFPRLGAVDGDDALARDPMTGERDIRSEDRQLLLDAIGAATETLVLTYTGANEYSGQARPPAVPLAELLDTLDITTSHPVRDQIHITHPLQPFDIRNVTPGGVLPGHPFTFDSTALIAARAAAGARAERPPFICGPLPAPDVTDVALTDLAAFFNHPIKGFFRALDYTLPWDVDGVSDDMPVEIDALEEWTVGDRLLADMLRGMTPADAQQAEWRRGTLPPGQLGWRRVSELRDRCAALAEVTRGHRTADTRAFDVDIDLGDGRRLTGTVSPVFDERLVSVTYSRLDAKHLLQSWIPLVALSAHDHQREWSAVCIGRARRGPQPLVRSLGRPTDPLGVLRDLVAIYDAGRREPLPLPLKTSYAWAQARRDRDDPELQAGYRWRSGNFPGEDADPAVERAFGKGVWLRHLMQPLRPGEETEGETNRLGAYSARLWLPLLQAERGV